MIDGEGTDPIGKDGRSKYHLIGCIFDQQGSPGEKVIVQWVLRTSRTTNTQARALLY